MTGPSVARRAAPTLATWLLVVLAADLIVTRVLLRLAIFIPKDPAVATVVGSLARAGAVVETLAALLAVALAVQLLLAARGSLIAGSALAATLAVGAVGLLLLVVPVTAAGQLTVGLLVLVAAGLQGVRIGSSGESSAVRLAGGVLAASIAFGGAALACTATGALSEADWTRAAAALLLGLGEVSYLVAALLIGLAGLLRWATVIRATGQLASGRPQSPLLAGVAVGAIGGLLALNAPTVAQQLFMWSLGLRPTLPAPFLALLAGLAVAGIGLLGRSPLPRSAGSSGDQSTAPWDPAAIGLGIVLAAGYGLAASYLLLAALLGLALVPARPAQASVRRPVVVPPSRAAIVSVSSSTPRTTFTE